MRFGKLVSLCLALLISSCGRSDLLGFMESQSQDPLTVGLSFYPGVLSKSSGGTATASYSTNQSVAATLSLSIPPSVSQTQSITLEPMTNFTFSVGTSSFSIGKYTAVLKAVIGSKIFQKEFPFEIVN